MTKAFRRLLAIVLAVLMCLAVSGCAGSESLVYMNYDTGIDEAGRYNYNMYGNNGLGDPGGPDPGVFYVSEEEDPEYGGYFYRYHTSHSTTVPETEYYQENRIRARVAYCDRSKDLYHWEPAGALAGYYSLAIDESDWCYTDYWAPEVIRNPADGKYYMYFSAASRTDLNLSYMSDAALARDRYYLGVAVSDTPVGPFDLIGERDPKTGILTPTINFQVAYGLDHNIPAIDVHPFFDDDGQLYLYFVRHSSSYYSGGNRICGMKMNSMAYPDYSTARVLAVPGKYTGSSEAGNLLNCVDGEDYFINEDGINEGPFLYKHNGKYYMTYSAYGYTNAGYSVHQAISDSPLGDYKKLSIEEGNPVVDGSHFGDVYGTGHHSLVEVGDELWIIYHRHSSINDGVGWDRPNAVDRINFVLNADGEEVMTSNGPSRILTWLPESISGYKNLAKTATISVNNGTGTQYLSDSTLSLYTVANGYTFSADSGDVTITLRWKEPVSVSSVMVYNSHTSYSAFSKVGDIRFKLAEKPDWASQDYDWAVVKDVALQHGAWEEISEDYLECAPAVAEFGAIMVTEIQITIKEADRLMSYDKSGQPITALDISEIVVLGGDVTNE